MAGLLYFKFGTQKSGIDHHFAPCINGYFLLSKELRNKGNSVHVPTNIPKFLGSLDQEMTRRRATT
jgi:hypothetical protein